MKTLKNKYADPTLQRDMLNAQINKQVYDAKTSVPTSGDVSADTFTRMADSFQGPEAKGWGGAAKAFMIGMAGGARQSSILDRKKDLEKYERVMDYLSAVNQEAAQRNAEFDKINQAKLTMQPKVAGFLQDLPRMSEVEIELGQRKLLDDYNALAGTDFKSAGFQGGSPQVALIIDGKNQTERVDLPSFFEIPGFEENLKLAMPNVRAEATQKQQNKREDQAIKQEQNQLGWENIKQRKDFHDPANILQEKGAKTAAEVQQKEIPKLDELISKSERGLRNLDEMDQIIQGNEDILQSQLMNLWMTEEPSMLGNALRSLGMKVSPEKSTAITKLNKFLNELVVDKASLFSRPNMFIEKVGSKSVPNWMMTPDAFKDMLAHMKSEVEETRNQALQKRNQYAGNLQLNAWGESPQRSQQMIKVLHKATGQRGEIPANAFNSQEWEKLNA